MSPLQAKISSRLVEFFPPQRQTLEEFGKHFTVSVWDLSVGKHFTVSVGT